MAEAVIVATARSPIGRAFKGSLVSLRPDDMAAQIVKAVLAKVPALDPTSVEDLMLDAAGDLRPGKRLDDLMEEEKPKRSLDDLLGQEPKKPEWPG